MKFSYNEIKKEIIDHIKFEKGNKILLLGGKNKGSLGTIEDILGDKVIYKVGNQIVESLKKYAFIIGKEEPFVTVQ